MKSLLAVISLALAFVSPAFAGIDWGFDDNGLNPSPGSAAGSIATIRILDPFTGSGWGAGGTTLPWSLAAPGAHGLWDLGIGGSIALSTSGSWGQGLVTIRVFQWVDPGFYNGTLGFVVMNGSTTVQSGNIGGVEQIGSSAPLGGAWWEYAANLNAALAPGDTVTVTAPGGALIDRLTLVPEPATLIAGAILLIPFALSTWPILRRRAK